MWIRQRSPTALPRRVGLIACLVALLSTTSLVAQDSGAQSALNRFCPVTTEEEADPGITTTYMDRTIAFCCDNCLAKFKANPERYFSRLASVGDAADEQAISPRSDGQNLPSAPGHEHEVDAREAGHQDSEDERHQHGGDEDRPPLLARVHPIIVHFPVAGVPLALLGFLLWRMSGKQVFAGADALPLFAAALAAIAAVITGNIAHDSMRFGPSLQDYVHWHQYAGTTVMILAIVLSALRVWRWNRLTNAWLWSYGGGLVLGSLLIGVTGYLGGSLVFGPDHLSW